MAGAMAGMTPVLVGMIAAAALLLMFPSDTQGASFIDAWSWVIFGVCMVMSMFKANPILLIGLSAVAGIFIYT